MGFILASASPRRQELLRNAGIAFTVQTADVSERRRARESPLAFAKRLAREKAAAVFARRSQDFVLGADTIVVVGRDILGKPRDAADARRMLRRLSGRTHRVITAVCLFGPAVHDVRAQTTRVTFARLTEAEIRDYVSSGEPIDKAGAYAIQGLASRWVARIDGCYFNVVGLPVPLVYEMLRRHNIL